MKQLDRIRASLIGGAAGDALGYEVEFDRESQIFSRYGARGITEYALTNGVAEISDDTQMTLFTANGLLRADALKDRPGLSDYRKAIAACYKDWLLTQQCRYGDVVASGEHPSRLIYERRLHDTRAPGNTCMSAIHAGAYGTVDAPINHSKGCGGVMRVAPVGLYLDQATATPDDAAALGAEAAAITHGGELGYLPAAAMAYMVNRLSQEALSVREAGRQSTAMLRRRFEQSADLEYQIRLIDRALELAEGPAADLDAIHELGEGWTGEEALAIALFCAARYSRDFDSALIAAVNHKGDSDSTGAIAGNLLGASLGMKGIPQKYIDNLELLDVIEELAEDLYHGIDTPQRRQKYLNPGPDGGVL